MDTSSPFFTPPSPVELDKGSKVTLSQLLQHVRASDQREAFLRDVVYNSPAPSMASSFSSQSSSRRPSAVSSRRSKRSGLIIVTDKLRVWSDDEDDGDGGPPASALTCSTLASIGSRKPDRFDRFDRPDPPYPHCPSYRSGGGRKRSLQSGWWDDDEDTDSSDEDDGGGGGSLSISDSDEDESPRSIPVLARRTALTPSKRSIENMKTFDPGFSFSRRCLQPTVVPVDPLDCWFAPYE